MTFSLLLATLLLFQSAAPLGMVLQVDGPVTIRRASKNQPARIADLVYAGDRLATGRNAHVTIGYCPTNQKVTVNPVSLLIVDAKTFRSSSGSVPKTTSFKCTLPQVALGAENLEQVGAVRARGDAPIALFTGGLLSTAQPLFRWQPVEGAGSYELVIKDDNDTTLWSGKRAAPLSEWRADASVHLVPGISYRWELIAQSGDKVLARESTAFELKPDAELAAVPMDPASRLQHAIVLENQGYFAEAAYLFREFRDRQPDDQRLTRHLIWLYRSAELNEAMNRELGRRGL